MLFHKNYKRMIAYSNKHTTRNFSYSHKWHNHLTNIMIAAVCTIFNIFCYDTLWTYHLHDTEWLNYLLCHGHGFILKTSIPSSILPENYIMPKHYLIFYLTVLLHCSTQSCSITMIKSWYETFCFIYLKYEIFFCIELQVKEYVKSENINCILKILRINIISSYKKHWKVRVIV